MSEAILHIGPTVLLHARADERFTSSNALSLLLTTEALLFAALAVGVSLSAPSPKPRHLLFTPRTLAFVAAIAIAAIAFGAATAWLDIFLPWSSSFVRQTQALALLAPILIQPAIAFAVAFGMPGRPRE